MVRITDIHNRPRPDKGAEFLKALSETRSSPNHLISECPGAPEIDDNNPVSPACTTGRKYQRGDRSRKVRATDGNELYVARHDNADGEEVYTSPETVSGGGCSLQECDLRWSLLTNSEDSIDDHPSDTSRSPEQAKPRSCLLGRTCDILASPTCSPLQSAARRASRTTTNSK